MAGCKLTGNLENKECKYVVAGARAIYLANFYGATVSATAVANAIAYQTDTDGYVDEILLPTGETFYRVDAANGTLSYSDALLAGGNGGKYRQHTVNATLSQDDIDVLNQGDALSLGKFIAIVVTNSGAVKLLGRTGGLSAPAGGFDFNTGVAEADASGWTLILQGASMEIAPLLLNEAVVTPIAVSPEIEE